MISIETIVGALFSGIMCRVYAAGGALWIAREAIESFRAPLAHVAQSLG